MGGTYAEIRGLVEQLCPDCPEVTKTLNVLKSYKTASRPERQAQKTMAVSHLTALVGIRNEVKCEGAFYCVYCDKSECLGLNAITLQGKRPVVTSTELFGALNG